MEILFIIASLIVVLLLIYLFYNAYYESFVESNSVALKNLREINSRYSFIKIKATNISKSYDNRNFFDDISCEDYLISVIPKMKNDLYQTMKDVSVNKERYKLYKDEIKTKCFPDDFSSIKSPRNKKKLKLVFDKLMSKKQLTPPVTDFKVYVTLYLTNISGTTLSYKDKVFSENNIKELISRINRKDGSFYLDRGIWEALCRVERGRVSNKLRFKVYQRDGNRCVKCGRKTNLEIDHIFPISRGGKSNLENLQTLCHYCNINKGANVKY